VNNITKLISIENAEFEAASDSKRKGQKFFLKKFKIILRSHVNDLLKYSYTKL
jgi:hypothetical protein